MTLEERLARTLHRVDEFAPSPDLFARVERSIEADRAHRTRVLRTVVASIAALATAVLYMTVVVSRDEDGDLLVRAWTIELLESIVLVALLLVLAPVIRRFGQVYVADVFHLDGRTGQRFLRLLDIAYFLLFTGVIVVSAQPTSLDAVVALDRGVAGGVERIAAFLALMGATHAINLLAMPAVGLIFNAVQRRARRGAAGTKAPPPSPRAVVADRVASWLVHGAAAALLVGVLLLAGMVIGLGLG